MLVTTVGNFASTTSSLFAPSSPVPFDPEGTDEPAPLKDTEPVQITKNSEPVIPSKFVREVNQLDPIVLENPQGYVNKLRNELTFSIYNILKGFGVNEGFLRKENRETSSDLLERYVIKLCQCTRHVKSLGLTRPSDEDFLKGCEDEILSILDHTNRFQEIKRYGMSEELVLLFLSEAPAYLDWLRTKLEERNIFENYQRITKPKENKKTTFIQPKRENPVQEEAKEDKSEELTEEPRKLEAKKAVSVRVIGIKKPVQRDPVGKVYKDRDTGNCLYMTFVGSLINEKGMAITKIIGDRIVKLEDLNKLSERQRNEIDIEMPTDAADCNGDNCIVLPTPFGFKASAISLSHKQWSFSLFRKMEIHQDIFGITRLYKVPKSVKSIRYRLEPYFFQPVNEITSDMVTPAKVRNLLPFTKEEAASVKLKILQAREGFQAYHPMYSDNQDIQRVVSSSENIFESGTSMGYIGDCEYLTVFYANLIKQLNADEAGISTIPILYASGYVLSEDEVPGFGAGHGQVLYLDENRIPHLEEATTLRDESYLLDEDLVADDTPHALHLIQNESQHKVNMFLHQRAKHWRVLNPDAVSNGNHNICTDTFLEGVDDEPDQKDEKKEDTQINPVGMNYKEEIKIRQIHLVSKIRNAKANWESLMKTGDLGDVLRSLESILDFEKAYHTCSDNCGQCLMCNNTIHRIILENDKEKYISDFLAYIERRKEKDLPKLQNEVKQFLELRNLEYRPIEKVSVSSSETYNLIEYPQIADSVFSIIDDQDFINSLRYFDLNNIQRKLIGSSCTNEVKLRLHEKLGNCCENKLDITYRPLYLSSGQTISIQDLSADGIRMFVSLLRQTGSKNEDNVEKDLTYGIRKCIWNIKRPLDDFLNACYESGVLQEYFVKDGDRIKLADDFKQRFIDSFYYVSCFEIFPLSSLEELKVLDIHAEDFIEAGVATNVEWSVTSGLENCGTYHLASGELDFNRPVSYLASRFDSGWVDSNNDYYSRGGVNLCTYLGRDPDDLQVNDKSQKTFWILELKPTIKEGQKYFPLIILPKKEFQELARNNTELTEFLRRSGFSYKDSIDSRMTERLFQIIPESRDVIKSRFDIDPLELYKQAVSDIFKFQVTNTSKYRFSILLGMLKMGGISIESLRNGLNKYFKANETIDINSLRDVYFKLIQSCKYKDEIKNEIENLSPEELGLFSAVIADERVDYAECIFENKGPLKYCAEADFRHWNEVSNKIHLISKIKRNEKSYWLSRLNSHLVGNTRYFEQCRDDFKNAVRYAESLSGRISRNESTLIRKMPLRYITFEATSGPHADLNEGDFNRHVPYIPGDDIRHLDQKVLARTDKKFIKKYSNPVLVTPNHYVADIESLFGGKNTRNIKNMLYAECVPQNIQDLVDVLYAHTVKNDSVFLHLFCRGHHLATLDTDEFRDIFKSNEEVTDGLSIRSKKADFVAALCQIGHAAKSAFEKDKKEFDYRYYSSPFEEKTGNGDFWSPQSNGKNHKKGKVIVLTSVDRLQHSMVVFQDWLSKGFSVAYWL